MPRSRRGGAQHAATCRAHSRRHPCARSRAEAARQGYAEGGSSTPRGTDFEARRTYSGCAQRARRLGPVHSRVFKFPPRASRRDPRRQLGLSAAPYGVLRAPGATRTASAQARPRRAMRQHGHPRAFPPPAARTFAWEVARRGRRGEVGRGGKPRGHDRSLRDVRGTRRWERRNQRSCMPFAAMSGGQGRERGKGRLARAQGPARVGNHLLACVNRASSCCTARRAALLRGGARGHAS